jgi:hypothetical protein
MSRGHGEYKNTPKSSVNPTIADIHWAAGFIEGDGHIAIYKNRRRSIAVQATQCNLEPLEKLQRLFGGRITKKHMSERNKQQPYGWGIYGTRAWGVLFTLYPLLSKRRQQRCLAALKAVDKE